MSEDKEELKVNIGKETWPILLLGGFQGLAYGGIFILIVPLSLLFWPGESYHPLEMGILISCLFGTSAFTGIFWGRLLDKHTISRKKVLYGIALFRGSSMIMMGLAIEGLGNQTWAYFLVFIIIFSGFAGGSWPGIVSISNDMIPQKQRSQFFGIQGIMYGLFTSFGFVFASYFVEVGLWRVFFITIGVGIIGAGTLLMLKIEEPKRGAQQSELKDILKDDSLEYDFQIDAKMMKKTMLSKTNLIALIEGISTNILLGALTTLVLPYLQTPPHNFSPFSTSIFILLFGLTGGLVGQLFLARISDKKATDKPILRIYFIIIALVASVLTFAYIFFLDLPKLTPEEGRNVIYLMSFPVMWINGALYLFSQTVSSLYMVNQRPLLQEINLPEAQGQITSWNQFLESIGYAMGPLIVGVLLIQSGNNYQITVIIIVLCVSPGILLWVLGLKYYPNDAKEVKKILEERAEILKKRKEENNK